MFVYSSYFTPDLCRPIFFKYKEEATVDGIHGWKYWLDEGFVANSTYNASNACYNPEPDLSRSPQHSSAVSILYSDPACLEPNYYDNVTTKYGVVGGVPDLWLPNGLLNVSKCKFDSAAYVSFPHFYLADPALLDQFHPESDLAPNEAEHSSYITILPKQGIPLEVAIRMQINVLYRPITPWIPFLEGVPTTFYPAIWFEV